MDGWTDGQRKMEEAQKDQSDQGWNNVEREGTRDGKDGDK